MERFREAIQKIKASKPKYQKTGKGFDGTCDCIGLIIGALERIGIKWTGIHGSNYSARRETVNLRKINSPQELKLDEYVYKVREQGDSKYALPARYKPGGAYYDGDLKDYYHVGVVTKEYPNLEITHMTSPTVKVDTVLGKWGYHGGIKPLLQKSGTTPIQTTIQTPVNEPLATSGVKAIVTCKTGNFVKMRAQPTTSCKLYDNIPKGTVVTIVDPGETWAKINGGRRKGWYMMAKFLEIQK